MVAVTPVAAAGGEPGGERGGEPGGELGDELVESPLPPLQPVIELRKNVPMMQRAKRILVIMTPSYSSKVLRSWRRTPGAGHCD